MNNKVKYLSLNENYELDVFIQFIENEKPIRASLSINQNLITLKVFNSSFNFNLDYEILTCKYNHNYKIDLINLQSIDYSTYYHHSNTTDITYTTDVTYIVEKVLLKEYNVDDKYKKLIIKSKDINKWVGFTKLQRNLGFEIKERIFNQHNEYFKSIKCEKFNFNIIYEINTIQNTLDGNITYIFLPYIELDFEEKLTFHDVDKTYTDLLNLLYLLLGFNLDVAEVIFQSEQEKYNNCYFYYKKDYMQIENKTIFIALANDLFEQNREELNLEIFSNYFKLDNYEKSFFRAFRQYKTFHYTEEKLLGYFRILEKIMYSKDIKFTQEYCDIYLENINLSDEKKKEEKELLEGVKNKEKRVINCPLKDRKNIIKFILYHNQILHVLPIDFKLIIQFSDVEKIVLLRNNIAHFNNYSVSQNDLEKYIDYLEFLTKYTLLKLIGYTEEKFVNNLKFYPTRHKIF